MTRSVPGPDLGFTLHEIVKQDEWNGMAKGDTVRVTDPRYPSGKFDFLCHATNIRTGKQWVDLWGGPARQQQTISVRPEFVHAKS